MTYSRANREEFLAAYVEAAVWASYVTTEGPGDGDDMNPVELDSLPFVREAYSVIDVFTPEAQEKILKDCMHFMNDNMLDLMLAWKGYAKSQRGSQWSGPSLAGHDFWLTRNHHGAGFWDRELGDVGDRLTEACRAYRELDLYVTDDRKIGIE